MGNSWRICILTLILVAAAVEALPAKKVQQVLPDLRVSNLALTAPATLRCGNQTVSFTMTETNGGPAAAPSYLLYLQLNNGSGVFAPVCAFTRPSLAANTSRTFTGSCTFWNGPCDCPLTSYTATFRAFIDPLNAVTESNEGNNLSNTPSIPATCP
jgi:subtilase family serine protease